MKKILTVLLTATLLLASFGCGNNGEKPSGIPPPPPPPLAETGPALPNSYDTLNLKKVKGKDFKILQFSDIQLDALTNGGIDKTEANCFPLMDMLVEEVKPDLIVMIGDNEGNYTRNKQEEEMAKTLYKDMIDKLNSYKIFWAPIFGNHERDTYTMEWQSRQFLKTAEEDGYCQFQDDNVFNKGKGVNESRGNYTVSITEGDKENIVYSLVFADSGDLNNAMAAEIPAWYENHIEKISEKQYGESALDKNKIVPSMVFLHRALPEYNNAAKIGVGAVNGIGAVKEEYGKGHNYEEQYDERMGQCNLFDSIKKLGSTKLVSCGHRHNNNSVIRYEGVDLMFGTKTGINNGHDKRLIGASVITIEDEKDDGGFNMTNVTLYEDYYEKAFNK